MSDPTLPDRRWIATVAGPIVALLNQALIYMSVPWACSHATRAGLHAIAATCAVAAIAMIVWARRLAFAPDAGMATDTGDPADSRFLARTAFGASAFAAAVILAQWYAVAWFHPCARS